MIPALSFASSSNPHNTPSPSAIACAPRPLARPAASATAAVKAITSVGSCQIAAATGMATSAATSSDPNARRSPQISVQQSANCTNRPQTNASRALHGYTSSGSRRKPSGP